jgi:hypothetical protein
VIDNKIADVVATITTMTAILLRVCMSTPVFVCRVGETENAQLCPQTQQ